MPDWISIANARQLDIPERELGRVAKPLDNLEEAFRPLVKDLTPDIEPCTSFCAEQESE